MSGPDGRPLLLLVGGGGGLVGRAVLPVLAPGWAIRSVHRHPARNEPGHRVEWVAQDVGTVRNWPELLRGVDVVVNLAWYRQASRRRFVELSDGLLRLVEGARGAGVRRFVHLSVPDAPPDMERSLPYLSYKRVVDRALMDSGLSYVILRPTMLFGPHDRLLTVMLRWMRRYRFFPMFGEGEYHISPLSVDDLARILRHELGRPGSRVVPIGGPQRWRYRELTDRMFRAVGRRPRYWTLSPRWSVRCAATLEALRSSLIYAYEVQWLLSDRLGLAPYGGLDAPLAPVEPFLDREASQRVGRAPVA